MKTVAVLASTSGSDLPALFEEGKKLGVTFVLVTNKEDCGAREKANQFGVENIFVNPENSDGSRKKREDFDQEVVDILQKKSVDFVFLVGYMRIISGVFVNEFSGKILNIHPSLLPAFAGGMDNDVHTEVLSKGCKITGATLHYVTVEVDEGPIFSQKACEISKNETPETLKKKVQILEQEMLKEALSSLVFSEKK